jgi:hypothetical protein
MIHEGSGEIREVETLHHGTRVYGNWKVSCCFQLTLKNQTFYFARCIKSPENCYRYHADETLDFWFTTAISEPRTDTNGDDRDQFPMKQSNGKSPDTLVAL